MVGYLKTYSRPSITRSIRTFTKLGASEDGIGLSMRNTVCPTTIAERRNIPSATELQNSD
jgi:hypothetical protein